MIHVNFITDKYTRDQSIPIEKTQRRQGKADPRESSDSHGFT